MPFSSRFRPAKARSIGHVSDSVMRGKNRGLLSKSSHGGSTDIDETPCLPGKTWTEF